MISLLESSVNYQKYVGMLSFDLIFLCSRLLYRRLLYGKLRYLKNENLHRKTIKANFKIFFSTGLRGLHADSSSENQIILSLRGRKLMSFLFCTIKRITAVGKSTRAKCVSRHVLFTCMYKISTT